MNKINFSLTSYFLNQKLFLSIADALSKTNLDNTFKQITGMDQYYRSLKIKSTFEDEIILYLIHHQIKSLEELLLNQEAEEGNLCIVYRDLYFKGLFKASQDWKKNIKSFAKFHNRLPEFNGIKIEGDFSPEHLTCNSALAELSGHRKKFIFGYIDEISNSKIKIRPIIIADRLLESPIDFKLAYMNSFKIVAERIDEFKHILKHDLNYDLNELKSYSERQIKKWFAEIICEKNIQKDWGGEKSDLLTTRTHVDGKRQSAAFLFKGPSKFHQMTLSDLGKNGDQIVRLFEEPVEVCILQHCHYIKSEVIKTMEAFASRIHDPKYYCTIDGIDTLRILKGYNINKIVKLLKKVLNIKRINSFLYDY